MFRKNFVLCSLWLGSLWLLGSAAALAGNQLSAKPDVYTRIMQLEDARSLGAGELEALLQHKLPEVRYRAALALGRIGDQRGTEALLKALEATRTNRLRLVIVFALGEIEDSKATPALLRVLESPSTASEVRARAAEALGKIVSFQSAPTAPGQSAGPANATLLGKETVDKISQALIAQLPAPATALTPADQKLAWLTITALLRIKSPAAVDPLVQQLKARNAPIRAAAANALARWGQALSTATPGLLAALADPDADVRANSARALGQSKAANAYEPLLKLLADPSDRVQVSAVRALGALGDRRAVTHLLAFGEQLLKQHEQDKTRGVPLNLLLDLTPVLSGFKDPACAPFLHRFRAVAGVGAYPEIENALLGLGEDQFWQGLDVPTLASAKVTNAVNLLAILGSLGSERAKTALNQLLPSAEQGTLNERVVGALLSAANRAKLACPPGLARRLLSSKYPGVRAAAAAALTEQTDENFAALSQAFEQSSGGKMMQARLSVLSAIAKYKTPAAVELLKQALKDDAPQVQRRAADLLSAAGVTDVQRPAEVVITRYSANDYARVRRLQRQTVTVTLRTSKGLIKVLMYSQDAPMTVDNFLELAKRGHFNGSPFHRIVPNFVAQGGGDPREEGGPGYQIRCEVNMRLYERGTLGMALAGKDTGSSQFFFCHAPQPHLDGGYTVFGQVLTGMEVVDRLTREDVIERIQISVR